MLQGLETCGKLVAVRQNPLKLPVKACDPVGKLDLVSCCGLALLVAVARLSLTALLISRHCPFKPLNRPFRSLNLLLRLKTSSCRSVVPEFLKGLPKLHESTRYFVVHGVPPTLCPMRLA